MDFNRWLSKNKLKPHHFAKQYGLSDSTIWRIYKRKFKPNAETAKKIVRATCGQVTFEDLMR